MGFRHALGGGLLQAIRSHGGQVYPGGEGTQCLVGADVAAGLLTADVLFSGLQGQHVAALALVIHGLAHDAAGKLSHVLGGGGHEAQVRSAVSDGHAQRLALAHCHVGAALPRALQDAQGDGVGAHDEHGAGLMDQACDLFHLFQLAVEVGLLDVEGSDVGSQHLLQGLQIRPAVLHGDDAELVTGAVAVGAYGVDGVGMGGRGDQGDAAFPVTAHGGGFRGGAGAVIHGGVGHVHAGDLADHGLILENGLQHALAHLGLVGRVRGKELLLVGDGLYHGGDVVIIGTGAPQHRGEQNVFGGHGGHRLAHFQLAHSLWEIQRTVQKGFGRHVLVQIGIIRCTDGGQHLFPLIPGGWYITHNVSPLRSLTLRSRSAPRRRRHPSDPRWLRCSPP